MSSLWVSVLIGCNKTTPQVLFISTDYEKLWRVTFKGQNGNDFLVNPKSEDFYDYLPDSFEEEQKTYYVVPSNTCCGNKTILIIGSMIDPIHNIDVVDLIDEIEENLNEPLSDLKKKYNHLCELVNKETKYYVNTCPECNKIDLIYYNGNHPESESKCYNCINEIGEQHNKELADLKKKYNYLCELVNKKTKHYLNTCLECNKIELIYYDGNNPESIKCDNCIN